MLGGPVPDATQWDQSAQVGDCASKVFEDRARQAAQGALSLHDDTAVRMVAVRTEHRASLAAAQAHDVSTPQARTGMPTTARGVTVGAHTAMLSDSSRRHAGANLQGVLDTREAGLATPLVMSAALSSHEVGKAEAGIRCHCLAHGRRTCSDVADVCPHACQVGREVSRPVCEHDAQARQTSLSPEARLAYPQAQSPPLRDGRTRWLATQSDEHLVEPTSARGKALGSLPRHWVPRTRFFSVPGAPLANTLAERALKVGMRQRQNSLLYQSPPSASMASGLPSLIAPCLYAGGNAVADLVARQEHRGAVCADPAAWLPWASASRRASPEATRRQARAIWARSGGPCHRTMLSSRADRGTRASALVGHQRTRPCASRCSSIQEPWPS